MSTINREIDPEFQELFGQISSETTFVLHVDFNAETISSEPEVDPIHVDWRQECREKRIAEVLQLECVICFFCCCWVFFEYYSYKIKPRVCM